MSRDYYTRKLHAGRLDRVYALAGPRVRQYLQAEIDHLQAALAPGDRVLELGCGTGRVLAPLAQVAGHGWGVDNAAASIMWAYRAHPELTLAVMDAAALGFAAQCFDIVVAVQNFISACGLPPEQLLRECLRVTRPGGRIFLSSYAERFWPHRLVPKPAQAVGPVALGIAGQKNPPPRSGDPHTFVQELLRRQPAGADEILNGDHGIEALRREPQRGGIHHGQY